MSFEKKFFQNAVDPRRALGWGLLTGLIWLGQAGAVYAQDEIGARVIKDPAEIVDNLWVIAPTILTAWLIIALVQRFLPRLANSVPSRFRLYILPWVPILRLAILFIATMIIVPLVFNLSTSNIWTVLGATGLAIGFAFKDYVSSLIAGIVAIAERPYSVGDWVQIGDDYGLVTSMDMRSLRMVTPDDTTIIIPHSRIWTDNIANANSGKRDHLCVADFYVEPNHDVAAARQKLWDVAMTSPYINLAEGSVTRPVVVIVKEEPWATHYRLKVYPIDGRDEFKFTSDLTMRGKAALARMGIRSVSVPAVPQ